MNELAVSGGEGIWWGWSCRLGIVLEWEGLDPSRSVWVAKNVELLMVHSV